MKKGNKTDAFVSALDEIIIMRCKRCKHFVTHFGSWKLVKPFCKIHLGEYDRKYCNYYYTEQ